MKALLILSTLTFNSYSFANNGKCNLNIDVNLYEHRSMVFNLLKFTKNITDQKGYIYTLKRSPYRSNIKVRIRTIENTTKISTFFNLYRYRNHLQHQYNSYTCLKADCTRSEILESIDKISADALNRLKICK